MQQKAVIVICWLLIILFIWMPLAVQNGAMFGIELFMHRLLPFLLPYLVVSQWLLLHLSDKGFSKKSHLLQLYGIGSLGGFPTGAQSAVTLYEQNVISKKTAERLIGICHAPSPMFVIGVIGMEYLHSFRSGIYLLVAYHLINLFFFSMNYRHFQLLPTRLSQKNSIQKSPFATSIRLTGRILSLIATTIIFFATCASVTIEMLSHFQSTPVLLKAFVYSFFEMTSGLEVTYQWFASSTYYVFFLLFIVCLNGLSIHMQVALIAKEVKLSLLPYMKYRLLHSIFLLLAFLIFWN